MPHTLGCIWIISRIRITIIGVSRRRRCRARRLDLAQLGLELLPSRQQFVQATMPARETAKRRRSVALEGLTPISPKESGRACSMLVRRRREALAAAFCHRIQACVCACVDPHVWTRAGTPALHRSHAVLACPHRCHRRHRRCDRQPVCGGRAKHVCACVRSRTCSGASSIVACRLLENSSSFRCHPHHPCECASAYVHTHLHLSVLLALALQLLLEECLCVNACVRACVRE